MTARRLWALWALVVLVLLASLGFAAARLGWHMQGHTGVLPEDVPARAARAEEAAARDLAPILALAPFGAPPQQPSAPDARPADTPLSITLRGVLVDPDPAQSRAFILDAGASRVLWLGDTVQGAELVAVNSESITLRVGERNRIVGFGGLADSPEPAATETDDSDAPSDPFARLAGAIVAGRGSLDLREAPPPETTEDYIDLWRERITTDPRAAMETVGVELVDDGYRVKEDPNIGVTLAGLKPGDVVTRLNGEAVGDLARDRVLYDEVAASGIARLEVVRAGQVLLLTFPLR